jgi:hypothetical protein
MFGPGAFLQESAGTVARSELTVLLLQPATCPTMRRAAAPSGSGLTLSEERGEGTASTRRKVSLETELLPRAPGFFDRDARRLFKSYFGHIRLRSLKVWFSSVLFLHFYHGPLLICKLTTIPLLHMHCAVLIYAMIDGHSVCLRHVYVITLL